MKRSIIRLSVALKGKANSLNGKALQIRAKRGAFRDLPILFSNDLVHGSWWMVWGSFFAMLIPLGPLIDIYHAIFDVPEETALSAFDQTETWILLIISSFFFTVGSLAFVRAFEDPPLPSLFSWYHFSSDELLAAWLYLFAILPGIPYSWIYVHEYPGNLTYIGVLISSILTLFASVFFVYICYPNETKSESSSQLVASFLRRVYGPPAPAPDPHKHYLISSDSVVSCCLTCLAPIAPGNPDTLPSCCCCCHASLLPCLTPPSYSLYSRIYPHLQTDWLIGCWLFFYATLFSTIGSLFLLASSENNRQIYVWATGSFDCLLFLIGCLYFVSGSYPSNVSEESDFDEKARKKDEGQGEDCGSHIEDGTGRDGREIDRLGTGTGTGSGSGIGIGSMLTFGVGLGSAAKVGTEIEKDQLLVEGERAENEQ